ncbi:hypothetical protein EYF80_034832 [Liparis tanakae]|uniref:Uncharacterized protein n=1 Tax=Liparis tanakae TaxID=230148 RepID=A0A4Z2GQG7_9TELE|nr:hypothetical protein EYF80_034832 [Liparis tanakae]
MPFPSLCGGMCRRRTSRISCPAPLYACSSSRIPLASFSTTSTCSHTSRSASVGWASAEGSGHKRSGNEEQDEPFPPPEARTPCQVC